MCKKQNSVSHSSAESEIISTDAGLRMDGILALDLWDSVTFNKRHWKTKSTSSRQETIPSTAKRKGVFQQLSNVEYVPPTHSAQGESQLNILKTTKLSTI